MFSLKDVARTTGGSFDIGKRSDTANRKDIFPFVSQRLKKLG